MEGAALQEHRLGRLWIDGQDAFGIAAKTELNPLVIQQLFKYRGIAVQRKPLKFILKIPVIPGQEYRHPSRYRRIDLLRGFSPLFHRIFEKYIFIYILGDLLKLLIFMVHQLQDGHSRPLAKIVYKKLFQMGRPIPIHFL